MYDYRTITDSAVKGLNVGASDCYLQKGQEDEVYCSAVKGSTVNRDSVVGLEDCYFCVAGNIYRSFGCIDIVPEVEVHNYTGGKVLVVDKLFCSEKKKNIDYEYCRICFLQGKKSLSAKRDVHIQENHFLQECIGIDRARGHLSEGQYSQGVLEGFAAFASTMRVIHENISGEHKGTVTELFLAAEELFNPDPGGESKAAEMVRQLMDKLFILLENLHSSLNGGTLKGDIRGTNISPDAAELAVDISSIMSSFFIRRSKEKGLDPG